MGHIKNSVSTPTVQVCAEVRWLPPPPLIWMRIQDMPPGFDDNVSHAASMPGKQSIWLSLQWATKKLLHYDLPPELLSSYYQKLKGNKNNNYSLLYARYEAKCFKYFISFKASNRHMGKCCSYANFIQQGKHGFGSGLSCPRLVSEKARIINLGSPGYMGQTLFTRSY